MLRKLTICGALAALVAVLPLTAAPAKAGNKDDVILGAITLGIVGAIIAERQKDRKRRRVDRHVYVPDDLSDHYNVDPPVHDEYRHDYDHYGDRPVHNEYEHDHYTHKPGYKKRHKWHVHRRHVDRRYRDGDHRRSKFERRMYRKAQRECVRQRWTDKGWETFVSQRCMSSRGY